MEPISARALAAAVLACAASAAHGQGSVSWSEVGALLGDRCTLCHSGEDAPLGLRLDSYEGAVKGSTYGPVLVPGDAAASELVRRVRGQSLPSMPLVGEPLNADEIALLERWIADGLPEGAAPVPEPEVAAKAAKDGPPTFAQVEKIFLQNCAVCHSDNSKMGAPPEGLRLDSYENIIHGGERLALIPGNPDASEIVRRVEGTAQPRMPYRRPPLDADQIELLRRWIAEGAADAEGREAAVPAGRAVRYRGVMTGPQEIDGVAFELAPRIRLDDRPASGAQAEMRGVVQEDGSLAATRLRSR